MELKTCKDVEDISNQLIFFLNSRFNSEDVLTILNTRVHRVFSIKYLLECFQYQCNTLVKPNKWDDPFENIILKSKIKTKLGREILVDELRESFFGQCWTLNNDETDALWRIYSTLKDGVRVTTTIGKLFDSYWSNNNNFKSLKFFIGKIKYLTEQEIIDNFQGINLNSVVFDTSGRNIIETLLFKREAFKHENEVRIIYRTDIEKENYPNGLYQYIINPCELFDELLFDPRIEETHFNKIKDTIIDYGFRKNIKRSKLYDTPNLTFLLDIDGL